MSIVRLPGGLFARLLALTRSDYPTLHIYNCDPVWSIRNC